MFACQIIRHLLDGKPFYASARLFAWDCRLAARPSQFGVHFALLRSKTTLSVGGVGGLQTQKRRGQAGEGQEVRRRLSIEVAVHYWRWTLKAPFIIEESQVWGNA